MTGTTVTTTLAILTEVLSAAPKLSDDDDDPTASVELEMSSSWSIICNVH